MMNMMNTTGMNSFSMLLFPLHALACLAILVGILFLIVWAIKTLTPAQLKKWGMSILAVGIALCLLVCALVWPMNKTMTCDMSGNHMMQMMDDDDMEMGTMMDHDMNDMDEDDMMGMSMDDMADMLEGKTGNEFDKAFIEGMIPHHQGAIDMARAAQQSAMHQEIKDMAEDIISAQQSEINMMKQWQMDWGFTSSL